MRPPDAGSPWSWLSRQTFDYYLQTATENNGILLGDTELGESDFKLWLASDSAGDRDSKSFGLAHALLSLAGVKIALPNLAPQHFDEILEVQRKYPEEISDYQGYIGELLAGAWDLVKMDPVPAELTKWATFVARTKIEPSLLRVEAAVRSGDRQLLERIGYGLLTDVPSVVAGQLRGSNVSMVTAGLEALLRGSGSKPRAIYPRAPSSGGIVRPVVPIQSSQSDCLD